MHVVVDSRIHVVKCESMGSSSPLVHLRSSLELVCETLFPKLSQNRHFSFLRGVDRRLTVILRTTSKHKIICVERWNEVEK